VLIPGQGNIELPGGAIAKGPADPIPTGLDGLEFPSRPSLRNFGHQTAPAPSASHPSSESPKRTYAQVLSSRAAYFGTQSPLSSVLRNPDPQGSNPYVSISRTISSGTQSQSHNFVQGPDPQASNIYHSMSRTTSSITQSQSDNSSQSWDPQLRNRRPAELFLVRYEENPIFVGRDLEIQRIHDMLRGDRPREAAHRVALHGMGGVGKTETTLAYVYRHRHDYTYVFWLSGASKPALEMGFQRIWGELQGSIVQSPRTITGERLMEWFRLQKKWLLIIDNLEDAAIPVLTQFVPGRTPNGHILVTTRNVRCISKLPAQPLEIEVLDWNKAVELFMLVSQVDPVPQNIAYVKNIVSDLG
jgi:hypothetical protein